MGCSSCGEASGSVVGCVCCSEASGAWYNAAACSGPAAAATVLDAQEAMSAAGCESMLPPAAVAVEKAGQTPKSA